MQNLKFWQKLALAGAASLALAAVVPGAARAGHGGSPAAIQQAIAANSVDAIQAELERAEHLVCAACVDLVMPLVDHPDARVRRVAAWWLARRAVSTQLQASMLNRLSQSDSTAARNAADVLGELHSPSSVPALGAALSNPTFSAEARAAMAQALGTIARPACAAHLTSALGDAEPKVRAASLVALRGIPGFRDGSVAAPLVGDGDETVRAEAAVTIATFRYAGGADALVAALSDPAANVRKKAAWALGAIHAPASVAGAALSNAAANDSSAAVRSLAHIALTQLSAS
ncbi:MAG TPA: HEAT repeat domain-containing protein [Polyangia bacterium]|nr:HEAT repeat domain-containing protein [Polyangia bacterium]